MKLGPRPSNRLRIAMRSITAKLGRPLTVAAIFAVTGSLLLYLTFAQIVITPGMMPEVPPPSAPNPTIAAQSCLGGLNIALLADVSGSITNKPADFAQMKTALRDFVTALIPSTFTSFSVSQFSADANVLQSFTSNLGLLTRAVDNINGDGGTNWMIGLKTAYGTFSTANKNTPSMLIIATDGNPSSPTPFNAIAEAVKQANIIKNDGIHILALGIGSDPTVNNLKLISGPNVNTGGVNADVITTDVGSMNSALQNIARSSCSGGGGGNGPGNGPGNGGNGTGTGNNGSGRGNSGTGVGNTGTGVGNNGAGRGNTGTGVGVVGRSPQPSPNPTPSAPQGVQPSPAPTNVPNQQPTPAPIATQTTEPTPTPAPAPVAQGNRTKPPEKQPSPFFDGKEYAPGSATDNFDGTPVKRTSQSWLYIGGSIVIALGAGGGGYFFWRRRKHAKPAIKDTATKASTKK